VTGLADRPAEFRPTLCLGLRLALLAILPALVFLAIFIEPIVRLVYERGAFDTAATSVTARAFLFYAPQLPFVAVDQLLIYAFYALKNTVTPMLVGLLGVGIYLGSALILLGPLHLGLYGLVLANTLQNILHAGILLALLWRAIGSLVGYGVGATLGRGVAASLGAATVAAAISIGVRSPSGTLALAAFLGASGLVVLGVYLVLLHVLRVEEVRSIPGLFRSRLTARLTSRLDRTT